MGSNSGPTAHRGRWLCQLLAVGVLSVSAALYANVEGWVDRQVAGPFVCVADFSLRDQGELFEELNQLGPDLVDALGIELSEDPVEVLLFRDRYSYQNYLSIRVPEGLRRPALFVKGADYGRVYAYRCRDFDTNLRHEGTHALLHASLPFVPIWLDEGLAEYFEVPAKERLHGNPHLRSVRWAQKFGWKPRLDHLESREDMAQMKGREYRDSWAYVHFMLHGPEEARDVLVKYLTDAQKGSPPGELGANLRRQMPDVEDRIVQHFRTWGRD